MLFGILTLITALAIAGVAAWFSIVGLMLLFSGSAFQIAVMAGTLEVGKLLTASWLYRYWKSTGILLKTYLTIAVVALMLITSIGIFGYLSKAAGDQASDSADALAIVERIDGQIQREENKISIAEDRIQSITNGTGIDNSQSITQQETIRDTAWQQVQGDIDYNQQQITGVRSQLTIDLEAIDAREATIDARLQSLDDAVRELREKGTEVITTDAGGVFRAAETETIDYGAQADALRATQQIERDEISSSKAELNTQRNNLRTQANEDIRTFQSAIDRYRAQAQTTIDGANAEINRLRDQTISSQDDSLERIDELNIQIDEYYANIALMRDEKFGAEQEVRTLEREVGPIKYLAQMIYGNDDRDVLDQAIRLFILLLVFVFDPLAVMLVIAANQTLLRYGINLEKEGPDDDSNGNTPVGGNHNDWTETTEGATDRQTNDKDNSEDSTKGSDTADDSIHLQQVGTTGDSSGEEQISQPSSVDDAADVMSQYDGRDKTFFESINEPLTNVDNQKTEDIVKQIEKTEKLEEDLNKILGGKTKAQLLRMASDGGLDLPAQLTKAEIVANVISNYDSITKKKI